MEKGTVMKNNVSTSMKMSAALKRLLNFFKIKIAGTTLHCEQINQ